MSNSVTNKQPTEVTICPPLSPCTKNMDVLTKALQTDGNIDGVTPRIQKQILGIEDGNQCGYLDDRINKLDLSELDDTTITIPGGEKIKFKYDFNRQFIRIGLLIALAGLLAVWGGMNLHLRT